MYVLRSQLLVQGRMRSDGWVFLVGSVPVSALTLLGDRKGIWPLKICSTYPQSFCLRRTWRWQQADPVLYGKWPVKGSVCVQIADNSFLIVFITAVTLPVSVGLRVVTVLFSIVFLYARCNWMWMGIARNFVWGLQIQGPGNNVFTVTQALNYSSWGGVPTTTVPESIWQTWPKPYHFFRWYGSQCKMMYHFSAH